MKNEDDAILAFFIGIVIGVAISSVIFEICYQYDITRFRAEAVKSGHAVYTVNEFGKTTFKFKDYTDKKNLAEKD